MRQAALRALQVADPASKVAAVRALAAQSGLELDVGAVLESDSPLPGRPLRPSLVGAEGTYATRRRG